MALEDEKPREAHTSGRIACLSWIDYLINGVNVFFNKVTLNTFLKIILCPFTFLMLKIISHS